MKLGGLSVVKFNVMLTSMLFGAMFMVVVNVLHQLSMHYLRISVEPGMEKMANAMPQSNHVSMV